MLLAHVRSRVAGVLGLASPERIALRQRLFDAGMDSLMAVELRNRLEASLGRSLRSTLVFDFPTIEALTEYLAGEVLPALATEEAGTGGEQGSGPASAFANTGDAAGYAASSSIPLYAGEGMERLFSELARMSEDEALERLMRGKERGKAT